MYNSFSKYTFVYGHPCSLFSWIINIQSVNNPAKLQKFTLVPSILCCSVAKSCPTLLDPMKCSTPSFPVPHHLPDFAQVHVHGVCDAIQSSHSLMPQSPPAHNLSLTLGPFPMTWLFTSGGQSFNFRINPSNEDSALISFRIDWFDLLAVQGTCQSLLQHHSSKAVFLWHSIFFMI